VLVAGPFVYAVRTLDGASELVRVTGSSQVEVITGDVGNTDSIVTDGERVVVARCSCNPVGGRNGTVQRFPLDLDP
jgi:hypothetical protein